MAAPPLAEAALRRALALPQFASTRAEDFSAQQPFADILRHDTRVRRYQPGDIVLHAGEYGSSVFFVLSGSVAVFTDRNQDPCRRVRPGEGQKRPRRTWLGALARAWRRQGEPEVRPDAPTLGPNEGIELRSDGNSDDARVFLPDLDQALAHAPHVVLAADQMFGEISAMARTPRTASIVACEPLELLEMRWQGLREIRRRAPLFREHLDSLYRQRSPRERVGERERR